MSKTERILKRLPSFYKAWDRRSLLYSILSSIGKRLEEADKDLDAVLRSHWVDTAVGRDLDKLGALFNIERRPGEPDTRFRSRLKRAIQEFKGGGTVKAILTSIRALLEAPEEAPIRIVENPPREEVEEVHVRSGDTWVMSSRSVVDAYPAITLTVESPNSQVTNPTITNVDTGEEVRFNGVLRSGDELVVSNGRALLNGVDVTDKLSTTTIRLLRRTCRWSYSEVMREEMGVFDRARFDESIFAIDIPQVKVVFKWTSLTPAAFELHVPRELLGGEGDLEVLEATLSSIKAAGVKAEVKVV